MAQDEKTIISGTPLGGFGTGYLRLGPDAIYRNITINNNRSLESRIPLSQQTYMALRCSDQEGSFCKILRPAHPDLDEYTPHAPAPIDKEHLHWRGAYPKSSFSYSDPESPVDVIWSDCSPIIPFDEEASSIPMILKGIRIKNKTDRTQQVSVLLNWENLSGQTGDTKVPSAPVSGALVEMPKLNVPIADDNYGNEEVAEPDPSELDRFNAVVFGPHTDMESNAFGQQCLAIRIQNGIRLSSAPWDHTVPELAEQFWNAFTVSGHLRELPQYVDNPTSAAVCATLTLPPREERQIRAAYGWYSPRFQINGEQVGNRYTNRFENAVDVVGAGLKDFEYYFTSVESWHNRIRKSTLPDWLNTMLINSCCIFTLNGLSLGDGRSGLSISTESSDFGPLSNRIYHSLGLLVFYERIEEAVMQQLYRSVDNHPQGAAANYVGSTKAEGAVYAQNARPQADHCATLALSAYRNYLQTGKMARLREAMPILQKLFKAVIATDQDRDGLPEGAYPDTSYDEIQIQGIDSPTSSLWIAGLKAYMTLLKIRKEKQEFEQLLPILSQAQKSFEHYFWDDRAGYYRYLFDPVKRHFSHIPIATTCHSGQLLGQWYSDALGMGALFDRGRMTRALATMQRYNERMYGVLSAVMPDGTRVSYMDSGKEDNRSHFCWPTFSNAHYATLHVTRGNPEVGLQQVEKYYRNLQYKQGLFNAAPNIWDVEQNAPAPGNLESHVSALSVWHLFYALIGLQVNIPRATLRLMPNLPKGIHTMNVPLFIPASLGLIKYQEDNQNGYRQRVYLQFDTPFKLEFLELRVPKEIEAVKIHCENTDGPLPTRYELLPHGKAKRLRIQLKQSAANTDKISFRIARIERPPESAS